MLHPSYHPPLFAFPGELGLHDWLTVQCFLSIDIGVYSLSPTLPTQYHAPGGSFSI